MKDMKIKLGVQNWIPSFSKYDECHFTKHIKVTFHTAKNKNAYLIRLSHCKNPCCSKLEVNTYPPPAPAPPVQICIQYIDFLCLYAFVFSV